MKETPSGFITYYASYTLVEISHHHRGKIYYLLKVRHNKEQARLTMRISRGGGEGGYHDIVNYN